MKKSELGAIHKNLGAFFFFSAVQSTYTSFVIFTM